MALLKSNILGTKLLYNTNRKLYPVSIEWYHFQWPWLGFQGRVIFRHWISQ